MDFNIHAGMRVLYKQGNSNWMMGNIVKGNAEITEQGIYIPITPKDMTAEKEIHYVEMHHIFFDAFLIEDWLKKYKEYFMTKEEYIKFITNDEFDKRLEHAYVSDGTYGYYPISKYNQNWIEKQPFEYVVRYD